MGYEIERAAPCRIILTATVAADEVNKEREHVVSGFVSAASIDGFRRGKAPRPLVERRFANEIREDLEEHLTRNAWDEVRRAENLRPASPLSVRDAAVLPDGDFRMQGEFDVYPTITLPEVEGFVPPPFDLEPTDEELDEALSQLRERQGVWEPAENEPAAAGMLVEAELQGEFPDGDGEPFHNERSLFQLGSDEVHSEIEAAVTGRSVGDEVTAERVIGEEGGEKHRGKRVAYRVRLKSLRKKRIPEADDGFAHSLGVEEGLDALREKVREQLRAGKLERRRDVWRDALVHHLAGSETLPLPDGVVKEETREELLKFAKTLAARGLDPEKAELDWKKLEQDLRGRVEERLRAELLLNALADKLGISVSAADVDHEVEQQARHLGTPFAELRGNLAKNDGLERVGAILRRERALDEILRPHQGGA